MSLPAATIASLGDELFAALRGRMVLDPLTARQPAIDIDDAYRVSLRLLERRQAEIRAQIVAAGIGPTAEWCPYGWVSATIAALRSCQRAARRHASTHGSGSA